VTLHVLQVAFLLLFHPPLAQYAVNSCEHHCRLGHLPILPYSGNLVHFYCQFARRRDAGPPSVPSCSISDSVEVVVSVPKHSLSFTPVPSPL
jgi:hypothetical protein